MLELRLPDESGPARSWSREDAALDHLREGAENLEAGSVAEAFGEGEIPGEHHDAADAESQLVVRQVSWAQRVDVLEARAGGDVRRGGEGVVLQDLVHGEVDDVFAGQPSEDVFVEGLDVVLGRAEDGASGDQIGI